MADRDDSSRPEGPPRRWPARRQALLWMAVPAYGLVLAWRLSPRPGGAFVALAAGSMMLARAASLARGRPTKLLYLALALAASALAAPPSTVASVAYLAAAGTLASVVALTTMLMVPGPPGLLAKTRPFPRWRVLGLLLVGAWPLATSLARGLGLVEDGVLGEGALSAAALGGFATLGASFVWARQARRLELGVPHRFAVAIAATFVGLALGIALVVPNAMAPPRAFPLGLVLASAVAVAAAQTPDAVRLARLARRTIVVAVVAALVAFVVYIATDGRPRDPAVACSITAVVATALGAYARVFEAPLRPMQGRWLDALAKAHAMFRRFEPEDALREALLALRAPGGPRTTSPELWTLYPAHVLTVDAAGYARERPGTLPETLLPILATEPEATLRIEVLEALLVRRPDLRPLERWLDQHEAWSATLVTRDGDTEGVLLLPRAGRYEPMQLEEARALKALADAFAGACAARAALARSHQRELEARARADAKEDEALRLAHEHTLNVGRDGLVTARLAAPAAVGLYSAAARLAYDALERRAEQKGPVFVVAPAGTDPIPWLARAHREGPRGTTPFVVVDGTASEEHRVERWTDPLVSPLALAAQGTLVLCDGAVLPHEIQRLLARALAERRAPWERADPLDVTLWMTGSAPPAELALRGLLDDVLAARIEGALEAPVMLPRLRDRAEDLRAIVVERLARQGLRIRGAPVGIEAAAFALLVEHDFPGEEAELDALVVQLVGRAEGPVVRAADVRALGLGPPRDTLAPIVELRSKSRRS